MTPTTPTPSRDDTATAACPVCAARYQPVGRQRFCSNTCRKTAWRRRHTPDPAAIHIPDVKPRMPSTVYECPTCQARYLGTQRCEDCATFCQRVGPGGLCPHCLLTHIRGRSLTDTFVIINEAQNLERTVLLTALSRLGEGSRVVLTHDVAQRDNLRVGRHDGVVSVIEALRGHPLFAHMTLSRSERSTIAGLVTALLEDHSLQ